MRGQSGQVEPPVASKPVPLVFLIRCVLHGQQMSPASHLGLALFFTLDLPAGQGQFPTYYGHL